MLTDQEHTRYSRQLVLPELGIAGQKRLKNARVLVVGAGGLGAPLLQYLCAAGVGHLGIVDYDKVELSNLHRQVLYRTSDVGRLKVDVAKEQLSAQNPHISINAHPVQLSHLNALELFSEYDVLADGSDNFSTRLLVNDACVKLGIPNVFASVYRFEGQVSVFNMKNELGDYGPNYRDLFPKLPEDGTQVNCAEAGVLGVNPGIIGCIQANEVLKILTAIGQPLSGKLLSLDISTMKSTVFAFGKRSDNPVRHEFADRIQLGNTSKNCSVYKRMSPRKLLSMIENQVQFQLIDVRETEEYAAFNIGGLNLPMHVIEEHLDRIARDQPVVLICKMGLRSASVAARLSSTLGIDRLYNLEGGLEAFRAASAEHQLTLP